MLGRFGVEGLKRTGRLDLVSKWPRRFGIGASQWIAPAKLSAAADCKLCL